MIELGEDPQAYLAESDDPSGYLIILGGLLFSIAMIIYSSYLYINTEDSDEKTPTAKKYEREMKQYQLESNEQERRAKFNRKLDQLISELDNPIDIFGESLNIIEASRRREEVIDELVKIGDKKAIGPLIKTAKKSDFYKGRDLLSDTRYSAIEALGKIGDESAIETLIEALSDQNKDIRGCAARSLDKLGWDPNVTKEKLSSKDGNSLADGIKELNKLKEQGILDDEEFKSAKKKLIEKQ